MNIIKKLIEITSEQDKIVESLVTQANNLMHTINVHNRLGIMEMNKNTAVGRGDIVLHPHEKAAYIATGDHHEGKPIVRNKYKTRALEPEFLTVGAMASEPGVRRAANRIATEHPTRRVLVYGVLPKKTMHENVTNVDDNPLPTKDKGIPSTWKKTKKDSEVTSKGAEVHNDDEPYATSMKQAGKYKKHKLGDGDGGNETPVTNK